MVYKLSRLEDGVVFEATNKEWSCILSAAEAFGWKPLGSTLLDENGEPIADWDPRDFSTHNGQLVCSEDASALAEALEAISASTCFEVPVTREMIAGILEWLVCQDGEVLGFEIY